MNVKEKVVKILEERLNLDLGGGANVDGQKDLFSEDEETGYGLDSVDALEIVVGLKSVFGISLRTEDLHDIMKNIDSLVSYVEKCAA